MSNFNTKIIYAIVVVCVCTMVFTTEAAQTNCQRVATNMAPCRTYLKNGGAVPAPCCNGVRSLKRIATTTALRRAFCECMKTQARSNGVNVQFASSLPANCNVQIGYSISYNTDCNKIN